MLTDYHTHTPLCRHAEGDPIDYARHAQSIGLAEFGLADHNPMPTHLDEWRMALDELPCYLELVQAAREGVPDLPIRVGLECDYLEGQEAWTDETAQLADWDYLIGSVHYIHDGIAVDDPEYLSRWGNRMTVEEMWGTYWRLYEKMIRARQHDFFAHPELAKRFCLRPDGDLRRYYEPVIQALVDTGAALEVNTAGLRKDVREIYPAREMLELAFSAKVPILINSDAHVPTDVGADFGQALALVRGVGYRSTVRFEKRRRIEVALPERWPV